MKYSIRKANIFEMEQNEGKPFRLTEHDSKLDGGKRHIFYHDLEYALYIIKKDMDGLVHRGWSSNSMARCKDCQHLLEVTAVDVIKNSYQDQVVYANWCPKCNDFKDVTP